MKTQRTPIYTHHWSILHHNENKHEFLSSLKHALSTLIKSAFLKWQEAYWKNLSELRENENTKIKLNYDAILSLSLLLLFRYVKHEVLEWNVRYALSHFAILPPFVLAVLLCDSRLFSFSFMFCFDFFILLLVVFTVTTTAVCLHQLREENPMNEWKRIHRFQLDVAICVEFESEWSKYKRNNHLVNGWLLINLYWY